MKMGQWWDFQQAFTPAQMLLCINIDLLIAMRHFAKLKQPGYTSSGWEGGPMTRSKWSALRTVWGGFTNGSFCSPNQLLALGQLTLTQLKSCYAGKPSMKVETGREKLWRHVRDVKWHPAMHLNHLLLGSSGESLYSEKEPALDLLYIWTINDANPYSGSITLTLSWTSNCMFQMKDMEVSHWELEKTDRTETSIQ